MSNIIIGSARIDEHGKSTGGSAGDQKQVASPDYNGELSLQNFYVHSKGWYVFRAKSDDIANKLAERMLTACNNPNIGYDQNQRNGINTKGIDTITKTECDCSSLVRQCIIESSGVDPGNIRTATEPAALAQTGLFFPKMAYTKSMDLYTGDILVTKTSGHTVIVVEGKERSSYYPAYTGASSSIVNALKSVGETDTSFSHRKKIASVNGISGYVGLASQNLKMVKLLKAGKLIRA